MATVRALARRQGSADATADVSAEATWYALFQTNFLFFVMFGLLAGVVLPQFESKEFSKFGLFHAAMSLLPSAAVVYAKGRSSLY